MKKKVIITTIIPSLNVVDYIEECLDSVRSQCVKEIEILCIDAGSEDGTREIIEETARIDDRVKLIDSPIKSYGFQVNTGIKEARGEYISIVESDDKILPGMYATLIDYSERYKADFVKTDYYLCKTLRDGEQLLYDPVMKYQTNLYDKLINPASNPLLQMENSYIWNGIYRTGFLRENNIFLNETPGAAFQDIGFYHKVICRSTRALYVKNAFNVYRIGREGASTGSGKGLHYARNEYNSLFFESGLSNEEIKYHGSAIDRKISLACFLWETDKMLRNNGYDPLSIEKSEDYRWFREFLNRELEYNRLNKTLFYDKEWSDLCCIMDNPREYARQLALTDSIRNKNNDLYELNDESKVIFGCGDFGKRCYKQLFIMDISVACFVDNNKDRWGEELLFKQIMSLSESMNRWPKADYIIANKNHKDEIKVQLLENGIGEDRIAMFEPKESD